MGRHNPGSNKLGGNSHGTVRNSRGSGDTSNSISNNSSLSSRHTGSMHMPLHRLRKERCPQQ